MPKSLKNKKDQAELYAEFKVEAAARRDLWSYLGVSGYFRMIWWSLFAKYRLICFMVMCCEGMAHSFAWNYVVYTNKSAILFKLKTLGWEE